MFFLLLFLLLRRRIISGGGLVSLGLSTGRAAAVPRVGCRPRQPLCFALHRLAESTQDLRGTCPDAGGVEPREPNRNDAVGLSVAVLAQAAEVAGHDRSSRRTLDRRRRHRRGSDGVGDGRDARPLDALRVEGVRHDVGCLEPHCHRRVRRAVEVCTVHLKLAQRTPGANGHAVRRRDHALAGARLRRARVRVALAIEADESHADVTVFLAGRVATVVLEVAVARLLAADQLGRARVLAVAVVAPDLAEPADLHRVTHARDVARAACLAERKLRRRRGRVPGACEHAADAHHPLAGRTAALPLPVAVSVRGAALRRPTRPAPALQTAGGAAALVAPVRPALLAHPAHVHVHSVHRTRLRARLRERSAHRVRDGAGHVLALDIAALRRRRRHPLAGQPAASGRVALGVRVAAPQVCLVGRAVGAALDRWVGDAGGIGHAEAGAAPVAALAGAFPAHGHLRRAVVQRALRGRCRHARGCKGAAGDKEQPHCCLLCLACWGLSFVLVNEVQIL
eukprot:Rhum_TRINITY_DN8602_c0_g1::Rhum_TRINITY_DN8602_c0_g1_i1::g.28969::m.28969